MDGHRGLSAGLFGETRRHWSLKRFEQMVALVIVIALLAD